MGSLTDRWRIDFKLSAFGGQFGNITVRASTPQEALAAAEEVLKPGYEITNMEKTTA